MKHVAATVRDIASTATFFRDKENEKKFLQAQLESLERSEALKQQQFRPQATTPPISHNIRNMCALNKVNYESVPMHVKFDRDPWQKTPWEVCGTLFERLFNLL
ncbi:hypothetical protein LguiB_026189 [Lonicera macranthoides]